MLRVDTLLLKVVVQECDEASALSWLFVDDPDTLYRVIKEQITFKYPTIYSELHAELATYAAS